LKSRLGEAVEEAYRQAVYYAAMEAGLDAEDFPKKCLYDWEEIMTMPFVWNR
jgi:hypothetical protein